MNDILNSQRQPEPRQASMKALLLAMTFLALGTIASSASFAQFGKSTRPVLQSAVFAKGLSKNQEPVNPGDSFSPPETVCLSLKFKGRPSKGVVAVKFYIADHLISDAKVDFASVNSGVFFSIGQVTYTGFSLKPTNPFPVSDKYRAEASVDGQTVGTYKFRVVAPADAIPSKIIEAKLAKAVDKDRAPVEPATVFVSDKKVYLAARADIGSGTALEVNWYVSGKLDPAGTKSLRAPQNLPGTRFYFAFLPAHGWPKGKHEAVIMMNGGEAGRYAFTVK